MKKQQPEVGNIKIIKSPAILKNIFYSYLWEIKQLDLIKYNKKMQIKCELNIENYKKASQKYLIVEKNGKGKEYIII